MEHLNYDTNIDTVFSKPPKIHNGKVWYVAILPWLGLFLENYAVNKWIGLALWLSVIILSIVVCIKDEKDLRNSGISNLFIYKARFFPPLYIYRRAKTLHQSVSPFIIFIITLVLAIINNGFTNSLKMNDETFIEGIKSTYTSYIKGLDENGINNQIEERLEEFAIEDTLKWSYSEDDKYKYITVSGLCNYENKASQRFEIVFRLNFDGYTTTKIEITNTSISGIELTNDEKNNFLYKIFIEENEATKNQNVINPDDYKTI